MHKPRTKLFQEGETKMNRTKKTTTIIYRSDTILVR